MFLLEAFGGESFLDSSSFWWFLVFFGLWLNNSSLCPCLHMAIFSVCCSDGLVAKSCLTLVTLQTVNCQAPLSLQFPRQEYWSALLFPSGDLPNPGIKKASPALQADSFPTEPPGTPSSLCPGSNLQSVY